MNKHLSVALITAGMVIGAGQAAATTLGLTTGLPSLSSGTAIVDYLEFAPDGDLSAFGAELDAATGVSPNGVTEIGFGIGFSLANPTSGAAGGFDIFDEDGLFLGGDLFAVGFSDDLIELQFNNLSGSGGGAFGSSVLMSILFTDPFDDLGTNPFDDVVDGSSYAASLTISDVVDDDLSPVPLPAGLPLMLTGLCGIFMLRRRS